MAFPSMVFKPDLSSVGASLEDINQSWSILTSAGQSSAYLSVDVETLGLAFEWDSLINSSLSGMLVLFPLGYMMFIFNTVQEEHIQIIYPISTRGGLYVADSLLSLRSFPASLHHPNSSLLTIHILA